MREKISEGYNIQSSDTATCPRLSDVISMSHPLQDGIWVCHCHTDIDSWSRRMRVKISKEGLYQGSDTATCLRLSDVISLSHPLQDCIWDCHCHTDTDSWSRWMRLTISKRCLIRGSDTATSLMLSVAISLLQTLWDCCAWHRHTATASGTEIAEKKFGKGAKWEPQTQPQHLWCSDVISLLTLFVTVLEADTDTLPLPPWTEIAMKHFQKGMK